MTTTTGLVMSKTFWLSGILAGLSGSQTSAATPSAAVSDRYIRLFSKALVDWNAYRPELFAGIAGYTLAFDAVQLKVHGANAEMSTVPDPADPQGCEIRVYRQAYASSCSDELVKFIFAHELFHCVQFHWSPGLSGASWVVEGSAEFAARDLYRGSFTPPPSEDFTGWFTATQNPLAVRDYDVWALYEAFKEQYAADPYPNIERMIRAGNASTATVLTAGFHGCPRNDRNLWI